MEDFSAVTGEHFCSAEISEVFSEVGESAAILEAGEAEGCAETVGAGADAGFSAISAALSADLFS